MRSTSRIIVLVLFLSAIFFQSCKSQELCPAYSQAETETSEVIANQT